jgi:hypothetical protein
MKIVFLWYATPSNLVDRYWCYRGKYYIHLQGRTATFRKVLQTTCRHTPEGSNLHNHRCRNLKPHMITILYRYQSVSTQCITLECRPIPNFFIIYLCLHVKDIKYNIKMILKEIRRAAVDRIHVSPYGNNWRALANGVKETRGSVKWEEFLD